MIKEGDWVDVKLVGTTEKLNGYVNRLNVIEGSGILEVCVWDDDLDDFIEVRVHRLEINPALTETTEEDIKTLVDLALDMGDKEWFEELSARLNSE